MVVDIPTQKTTDQAIKLNQCHYVINTHLEHVPYLGNRPETTQSNPLLDKA